MRQKVWVTSLCLAVKYVGAQKFCAMLLRRHPEGVDIVARKHDVNAGVVPEVNEFDSRIGHHVNNWVLSEWVHAAGLWYNSTLMSCEGKVAVEFVGWT